MISALLAVVAIAAAPSVDSPEVPGDGLSLLPAAHRSDPQAALPPPEGGPASPGAGAIALQSLLGLIGVVGGLRPSRLESGDPVPGPAVVVIPGFGSPAAGTFDDLLTHAGVAEERVHRFDWRWVTGDGDHATAARRADTERAADTLESFLGLLAETNDEIYVVGHSKGGALIAELTARWDADPGRSIRSVSGAMLLDPPIASGELGRLQRLGARLGAPSNGGYDPIECGWLRCHDTREWLGFGAGIDVVVIRNPDALVTSFTDEPRGLRVLDLEDDGGGPALERVWERGSVLERVVEAHHSPLAHVAVAACLRAELDDRGSCAWDAGAEHGPSRRRPFADGGGGSSTY